MPSLRDIRQNIKSVKSTRQITCAMKMVAAARIRRAQGAILSSRPFALKMEQMIEDLQNELVDEDFKNSGVYRLFVPFAFGEGPVTAQDDTRHRLPGPDKSTAAGLVLISSDRGLCGAFNSNLFRSALEWINKNKDKKIYIIVVGRKARNLIRRIKGLDLEIIYESIGIFPHVGYVHAELLGRAVLESCGKYPIGSVTVIYNEFKSLVSQRIIEIEILPLQKHPHPTPPPLTARLKDFFFEPEKKILLEALLPRYIKAQFYRILLESQAAELSARMNAMESASKNASELIEDLTLKLNKTRQSMITNEISDITGGAEALRGIP